MDALVTQAMHRVDLDALASPLARTRADVTPLQVLQMARAARRLRSDLGQILHENRLEPLAVSRSAAGDASADLHRAQGLLADLLRRAAGQLGDEKEADLRRIVATLEAPIQDMLLALTPPPQAAGGADRPAQQLASLRHIVEIKRLTHLRPAVAELAEYLGADELRIAVAGRTNAGKSSLINDLLGMNLLPAAPLPATAVPVFIRHGEQVRGSAEFADAIPEVLTRGRLAEFADARYNPANERHVTRLVMQVPASILEGGVCLVDVPGWNGHATIPQCDIGLVLIDAGGDLELTELALVDALRRAGAEVLVLLTKADRLTFRDRSEVHGRVMFELLRQTGGETSVYLASTTSDDAALRKDWVERGLGACLRRRGAIRQASVERKLALLDEAVATARRTQASLQPAPQRSEHRVGRVRAAGLRCLEALANRPQRFAERAAAERARLLDELAHNGAVLLRRSREGEVDLGTLLRSSLEARAAAARHDAIRELENCRSRCADLLSWAGAPAFRPEFHLPAPTLDAPAPALAVQVPGHVRIGDWSARLWLHSALGHHEALAGVDAALSQHFEALARWRAAELAALTRSFDDACRAVRAPATPRL